MATAMYMRADAAQTTQVPDWAPFLGTWENLDPQTRNLLRVSFRMENGSFRLGAVGAGPRGAENWGEVAARTYVANGTARPVGFVAHFDRGSGKVIVSADVKRDLCILRTYTSPDRGEQVNLFSKEYFMRQGSRERRREPHSGSESIPVSDEAAVFRGFLGDWANTCEETRWVHELSIRERDGRFFMAPQSLSHPHTWGESEIHLFRFIKGESAFCVGFDLDGMRADLEAYTNKGLIVIAIYLAFSGRPDENFLAREFYLPKPTSRIGPFTQ